MKPASRDAAASGDIRIITDPAYDVSGKYMAVGRLKEMALTDPGSVSGLTAAALSALLRDEAAGKQTQAYFLFREAALVLRELIARPVCGQSRERARRMLTGHLASGNRHARRGAAEALGSLPLVIRGPDVTADARPEGPRISITDLLSTHGAELTGTPRFMGRSMLAASASGSVLLVVKMARAGQAPRLLDLETRWMAHMQPIARSLPVRFEVPSPCRVNGGYLFRLAEPLPPAAPRGLHPNRWAVAFTAHPDYFVYPNGQPPLPLAETRDILLRNAWLLGRLTAMGIVHTAPIPLFHNRVQQHRREDRGLFQWALRGRLDQWLASCAYPNLGGSGPRDFEHLEAFSGKSRKLYGHIGSHLLSLILVLGSCFRARNPEKVGLDERGRPADARDLFDQAELGAMTGGIFKRYYEGFVGVPLTEALPFDLTALTERMIEEMGVDRHMEEMLRARDQERMSNGDFVAFLSERGFSREEIARLDKGKADITLMTGPHLGGFNDHISLPELIDAIEGMAALCVCGKHCDQFSHPDQPSSQRPSASRSV